MRNFTMAASFALLASVLLSQSVVAQPAEPAYKPTTTFYGESAPLSVLALNPVPVSPQNGQLFEAELDELFEAYEPPYQGPLLPTPFVQTVMPRPSAAVAGESFEGPGTGLTGFNLTGAPPDMTLAVGPNHVVAWVNSQYAVFNKTGTVLVAPLNGNALFAGMGGVCETTNRGDPILQYDRLAQRWILSQFAFGGTGSPAAPYLQCFAVSTTPDPTGTYYRYSVQFSATSPSGFNDYGKLGVWPDGYYTAYNIFGGSPAGSNTGAALCASDRVKMLAGDPTATTLCAPIGFYGGGASFLPADLDGTTLPSTTAQGGIFMRISTTLNLRYVKLKPDFTAGTVTVGDGFGGASGSFINIPVGATTQACNGTGGTCIAQPGTANTLDTLGSRLMYRLAYRNRGGVESMVVTHSVDPDNSGVRGAALRWYEIRNPLGDPADPVVANRPVLYQNSTYNPATNSDRWMGSIAMDKDGNMMAGYSIASTTPAVKPSIAVAGRLASDPLNTLQSELVAYTGTGSQTGTLSRWGDYSTMQVDPADDSTFWYIGQYLAADGTFNWRSRIVSYKFPGQAELSIANASLVEGNSGTSNMQFTITRSSTQDAVSVTVNTSNGTATAGSDYTAVTSQVVNFTAGGAATATVSVPIIGDTVLEGDETFTVTLSNPTAATITTATATGAINNDDAASLSIFNVTLAEGNSGTTNFVYSVTLSGAVQGSFTVPYATSDNTATQPSDYASTSGTLTFTGLANQVQTITVPVVGDTILEPAENYFVGLGAPSNPAITLSFANALGTITNDDAASIAIGDVSLAEGNSGTTNFVFNVTLTGAVQGNFTVPYSTANGTATQPSDYASTSGTLTFTGAANEATTITVPVVGDTNVESDETFSVNLGAPSNAGVTTTDGSGLGTIVNDDFATLTIDNVSMTEGNLGFKNFVFTATLDRAVPGSFSVTYFTVDGTATQPSDYTGASGVLAFNGTSGETRFFFVSVSGDTVLEPDETFSFNFGTPSSALVTVAAGGGIGTITNDDAASIAINNVTLAEGNSGTTNFVFNVALTGSVQDGFTIPYSTADGSATQPGDYASTSGTLTFVGSAGEVNTITVPVVGDLVPELVETFFANLGAPSNAAITISQAQGTAMIVNDDLFADVTVTMTDGISAIVPGDSSVYTVTVTNTSTLIDVAAVQIAQTVPATLTNISWTCTGSGGATCPANGTGALLQTRAMPAGGSLVYLVSALVDPAAAAPPASIIMSVTATVMAPHSDPMTANNTASDSNTLILDVIFRNGFDSAL